MPIKRRSGLASGLAQAAENMNESFQRSWSEAEAAKRQQELAGLQDMFARQRYTQEHPNPATIDTLLQDPTKAETMTPELMKMTLQNASRAGSPNVPREEPNQSKWTPDISTNEKAAVNPDNGQDIQMTSYGQTTPFQQIVDANTGVLSAQKSSLEAQQARQNREAAVPVAGIGPGGEMTEQFFPRGSKELLGPHTTGRTAAQEQTFQQTAATPTPGRIEGEATLAGKTAEARLPAEKNLASFQAKLSQDFETKMKASDREYEQGKLDTAQYLHQLDEEEQAINPQAQEMLKMLTDSSGVSIGDPKKFVDDVSAFVTARHAAIAKKREDIITNRPRPLTTPLSGQSNLPKAPTLPAVAPTLQAPAPQTVAMPDFVYDPRLQQVVPAPKRK